MKIKEIKQQTVSIASDIRNAYIDFSKMTVSVVAIVTDQVRDGQPVIGYGFNSNGRYAQRGPLTERFIPRLFEADPAGLVDDERDNFDPHKCWDVMFAGEKPGGHGDRSVAVGVLDMALWDIVAKLEERTLYRVVGDRFTEVKPDESVNVYAAGGYYYLGKEIDGLLEEMRGYLDLGYTVVKMKIGGAPLELDLQRIEAVVDLVGDASRVAVDANGRFDLDTAVAYAEALDPFGLYWYEEAGDPLDYALQAELAEHYEGSMATGENLFSHQDVRNLARYAGMRPDRDRLQMDPALSYGLVEYLRMVDVLVEHGWSRRNLVPHGGHQMNLGVVAGLGLGGNESYPGVFPPFGGFADDHQVEGGVVTLPETPGVGFEAKRDLYKVLREVADG